MKPIMFLSNKAFVFLTMLLMTFIFPLSNTNAQTKMKCFDVNGSLIGTVLISDFQSLSTSSDARVLHMKNGNTISGIYKVVFDYTTDDIQTLQIEKAQIYPNPISVNGFTINCDLKTDSDVSIEILSISGSLVYKVHLANQPSNFVYNMNPTLPCGLYICNIKTENHFFSTKIIKN